MSNYAIVQEGSFYKIPVYTPDYIKTDSKLDVRFANPELNQEGVRVIDLMGVCLHYLESKYNTDFETIELIKRAMADL